MSRSWAGFTLGFTLLGSLLGQAPGTPVRSEIDYFRHVFMAIGNLEDPASDLQRREKAMVRQFGLNPVQAQALHAVAGEFRTGLAGIRTAATSVLVASRGTLTDADRGRLNELAADRGRLVERLAARLMKDLGPEAAERLRAPLRSGR